VLSVAFSRSISLPHETPHLRFAIDTSSKRKVQP
jgi:hypothetical protein